MQEIFEQLTWESLLIPRPIYTIGYGGRAVEQFLELLRYYKIQYLIDIRSQPHSRVQPQFSKDALDKFLKEQHINYVFMGDTLGGRPSDDTCYVDGKVDYTKVRERAFYQHGIHRIHTAWEKQFVVALMCAEMKPQECHRSKLIGNTLHDKQIEVAHIDEQGILKTQEEVINLLMKDQPSLFDQQQTSVGLRERMNFSRKKYPFQRGKAAWTKL